MGIMDKITGRAKQAAGDVAGSRSTRREGEREERKGDQKERAARAEDRAEREQDKAERLERST